MPATDPVENAVKSIGEITSSILCRLPNATPDKPLFEKRFSPEPLSLADQIAACETSEATVFLKEEMQLPNSDLITEFHEVAANIEIVEHTIDVLKALADWPTTITICHPKLVD